MKTAVINFAISPAKALRLYWLGRYSERVCTALHLLRKSYDSIIDDENSDAHREFCNHMGIACEWDDARTFVQKYLYDTTSSVSVINMLERVMDNAILLREEIKSESLSYIELAINHMKRCSQSDMGLYELQYVTDSMYAFWGVLEDRILNCKTLDLIKIGKNVERLDLFIRFDYPTARVREIFHRLESIDTHNSGVCKSEDIEDLKRRIEQKGDFSLETLHLINALFAA